MRASTFQPVSVTVARNVAVSFQNSSGVDHNIIFDSQASGVTDIGLISSGTVTRTFATAGSFALHCTIHAGMTATVVVQ
jgi:plastocyanin